MLQNPIPTLDSRKIAHARWWLLRCLGFSWLLWGLLSRPSFAAEKWTEFNLGPFYVDTDGDPAAARSALTQLEQTRWVMEGLLENKDLSATWPIRVLITKSSKPTSSFVLLNGYYLLVKAPGSTLPLGEVAKLFLQANTPRLPLEVEHGIGQLFDTLQANGSRVSWGAAPAQADLDFARMQMLATKFEYGTSFHIFVTSLRNGSTLHAAEHNAYGQDFQALEQEAATRLAANVWQPVTVSGRPLDPKRDFGEHPLDPAMARVYCASALVEEDAASAEPALRQALNEGGSAAALAFESLGEVARRRGEKPDELLTDAMNTGSKSAAVYVDAAENLPPDQALPLLQKAQFLNPSWAKPVFAQAEDTDDLAQREVLMKKAVQLDPRQADYWVALARTQMANGHALAAQASWLRAEDAAPDDARRKFIQKLHESMESTRLDAAESERKRERDEARLADQHALQAGAERIHAAEERANKASASSSDESEIVDWNSLVKPQKIYGTVLMVDCRSGYTRLAVRDLRGKVRQLLSQNLDTKVISCDYKPDKRQIVVTFRPHDDTAHGTDGDIVSMGWR